MRKIFLAVLVYFLGLSAACAADNVSSFHRILLLNDRQELMMVRIEGRDFWVTPGWYQDSSLSAKQGLEKLVSSHGLAMTAPELRGSFTLRTEGKDGLSVRHFHVAYLTGGTEKLPEGIAEIKWLPFEQALEIMTFDHISMLARQVVENPGAVWGGSVERYGEDFARQARVTEEFYPLYPVK